MFRAHSLVFKALLAATIGALVIEVAQATNITGAGSTFAYPILSKWAVDYQKVTGAQLNYQSIGSGGGIKQIKTGTVTFGASDMPLTPENLEAFGAGQFPIIVGGVVPVVNIAGVRPGALKFTGTLLADIYLGKVTKWKDPAIAKLNPGVTLPAADISVVYRSDGSGTTFNWVDYLSKISPAWKSAVGEGTSVSFPVGTGSKGNEGVAATVQQIANSIGYVEYAYAMQNHMTYGQVQNRAGQFISPSARTFQAAAATADWQHSKDFDLVITDAPGQDAYPISASVFVIMYKKAHVPAESKAAFDFFKWALEHGQKQADELQYVALPPDLVKQIEGYWATNFGYR